jgi:phage shock protein A
MTTPESKPAPSQLQTIKSLTVEISSYESAIAAAESQGRGMLPQVELLRTTLGEMRKKLGVLKQADKE